MNFNGLGNVSSGVTSLMYGPDGRLYVAEYPGTIKILTVQRNSSTDYVVTGIETLNGVKNIANHDDDGSPCSGTADDCSSRETTGLTVAGTAANPVIYVTSSDFRIGSGPGGGNGDVDLDTNSGIITRFSWNGSSWDVVDIVRGLPRSEENHATNGLEFVTINGSDYLIVASGGHTNAGGPSTNFVYTCEYALSAAILSINLDMLNSMGVQTDVNGRNYIYDIPTLDDPTRPNVNGITDPDTPGYNGVDINDPWGGNDGLNQATVVPGGPVQILSPGYRNSYDLVVTQSGALYVTDNGANGGWGGFPVNEGGGSATNAYDPAEPGSQSPSGGEQINNADHLQLITTDLQNYSFNSYYGGHPNPTRANPNGAGLYTAPGQNGNAGAVFRTLIYDPDGSRPGSTTDPAIGLPANWPPVSVANTVEGDWRGPGIGNPDGPNDNPVTNWGTNTNGIDEYTASNFGGAMQGNLLAGTHNGIIRRVQLNGSGTLQQLTTSFLSGIGGNALGITCNSDAEIFPGTIWAGTLNGNIVVFEPQDFVTCINPGEPGYDPNADYDVDGYTNQDEEDNGTDPCNGGSQPADFDKVAGAPLISDLNDTDDDADGIADANDPFQLGNPATAGSDAFELPVQNDLFNDQQGLGGIFGLGLTGLMNNGDPNPNWLDWLDDKGQGPNPDDVLGGAPGLMTSHMTAGTALGNTNTQEKGYQYGVQVDQNTGSFTVVGNLVGLTGPLRLYGNAAAVGGELGHFIGDGTQSNYIKIVLTVDGITALQEINDVPQTPINVPIAVGNRPTSEIRFYFVIDPASGEVDLQYSIDGGARSPIGIITAQGSILTAIQNSGTDLAVGFTGTSGTAGVELEGTWDFLNVIGEVPTIEQQIPDITRTIDSADEDNDLNEFFEDDNGDANLTYTIESNSNPSIGASVSNNILTLSYPSVPGVSDITVRATDADSFFVEQTFTVTVTDAPIILYRVNAGGPAITAIDGDIDWEADQAANNSQYLVQPAANNTFTSTTMPVDGSVNQATTPMQVFATERYDANPGAPNVTYSFPVSQPGNYEIRLYMGNSFSGTSQPGQRIFDASIEGIILPLLNDIDLSLTYGHQTGTVITHILNVTDGAIDISLLHGSIENPLINAIEILDAPDTDTPIYVHPIADQIGNTGQQLDGSLGAVASGGDGNLQFSATGLPTGLVIEPTNGQIGGTIDASASSASPFNVSITVDDSDGLTSDAVVINFVWTVIEATAYRINVGGTVVPSGDIHLGWEDNSQQGMQVGGNYTVNTGLINGIGGVGYQNRDASIPGYIGQSAFDGLFAQERYDGPNAPEMEYSMPLGNGDYVVNFYMANRFAGTSQPGQRLFDILLEGAIVREDLDLITEFGHQVAGMLSFPVSVTDGELNISFGHVVENPTLNAIEVFVDNQAFPALTLNPIANQNHDSGEQVNLATTASGGDPGENISYYISGQPLGIGIDVNTGQITGTVDIQASIGGPNGDGVHTTRVSVLKPGSPPATRVFTWTVAETLTWTDKDEDENYTARHECSFVQAGDKFLLMGGRENAQTIDIYDYTSDSWTSLPNSAPVEFNHYQATEYQGLIWVIGAFQDNNFPNEVPADFIWAFDPANQEWIQGPEIPAGRKRGSAGLVVYNDKFYIVAGNTVGHNGGYVNWFDEYDPATGTWTALANAPRARDHFHAAVIGDKLYAVGGRLSGGAEGTFKPVIAEVDVYDFTTATWSTLPAGQNLPTPRGAPVVANFNDRLVVAGGEVNNELVYGVNTNDAVKVTEEFDPATGTWTRLPDMNFERHGTQGIVSGNGLFVLAGSPNIGGGNQKNMEFLGEDAPVGTPSDASELSAPTSVLIADGASENFNLDVIDGNVGIIVRSMELSGANAADFSIDAGELENGLLNPGSSHSITVSLSGTGANRSAILTVNYGASASKNIILSNEEVVALDVTNPGDQYNYEGDSVTLPIEANSANNLTFSATGLPPTLTINPTTGVISGIISEGSVGSPNAFNEENGLLVVEAESGTLEPNWTTTTAGGETGIIAGSNHFNDQNGGTVPYELNITTPGVYRFNWNSFFSGPLASEENDNWLRFPNNDDVWFFGIHTSVAPDSEASIIANLQGAQTDVVFPIGSSRITPGTTPLGNGGNGYFKVYRSGGSSEVYSWEAFTSDNNSHNIYVWFVNPGVYTMEISERSAGHAIEKFALYRVDGPSFNNSQLNALPESSQGGGGPGAAANSPYNVTVFVTDDGNPPSAADVQFQWIIGEPGDLIAVPEADPVSGEAPLLVNFTGSNSLDDVGVTSYLWEFMDGTPNSTEADPQHTFTDTGTYEVALTVGDIDGNSSTNTVTITVSDPALSDPPLALAEATPLSGDAPLSVTFTGSNSTDDVGITSYAWDFMDGSPPVTEADAMHTFLAAGIYDVELTVTDGDGQTDTDVVTITVDDPGLPPVVDAGVDQTITLPENSIILDGSASDPDGGTIETYLWTQESGPSAATLNGADTEDLSISDLEEGEYIFWLTVTDDEGDSAFDEVTVTVLPDGSTQLPVADAGEDQSITLPENNIVLDGSATDPDGGTIETYLWTQVSGPSDATLAGADSEDLSVSDLLQGEYVFRLTVTDDEGEEGFDEVTVTVLPEGGTQDPVADAGADQTLILPENSVILNGSAIDPDGGIIEAYLWTQVSGPSAATLAGAASEDLSVSDLLEGEYIFRLTVTDDEGEQGFDEVTVTVLPEGSTLPPVVDAGPDRNLVLPDNALVLEGSASDPDGGTITSYLWTQQSGPSTATLSGADTEDLSVSDLEEGEYVFRLTVTDDEGETNFDEATVTVSNEEPTEKMIAILEENPSQGGVARVLILNKPSDVVLFGFYFHDANGRLIGQYSAEPMSVGTDSYEIPVATLRDGMYFVTLIVNQGERIVLKLLVKN